MTLPSLNSNNFDKHKACELMSNLKEKLQFDYIYAITITKVQYLKFHDPDDTSIKAVLHYLHMHVPITDTSQNEFYHCSFKAINIDESDEEKKKNNLKVKKKRRIIMEQHIFMVFYSLKI